MKKPYRAGPIRRFHMIGVTRPDQAAKWPWRWIDVRITVETIQKRKKAFRGICFHDGSDMVAKIALMW
jgi:hypothetical protein